MPTLTSPQLNLFSQPETYPSLLKQTDIQDKLLVQAAVVGWCGKAIVILGKNNSSKTLLVAALVKAGATYYSDEYAVLDTNGLVHPFPRHLLIQQGNNQPVKRCFAKELGDISDIKPLLIGLLIYTQYQQGKQWQPIKMSMGEAGQVLLDNILVARLRLEFALPILSKVVLEAVLLKGFRDDADETAKLLLQQFQ